VFDLLDNQRSSVDINWWRPGGPAWFTVLHQAAWHGAPVDVAGELIRRRALRCLRDARGHTAYDVRCQKDLQSASHPKGIAAQQRKSLVLRERYLKPPPSPLPLATIRALDHHLADLVDSRVRAPLGHGCTPSRCGATRRSRSSIDASAPKPPFPLTFGNFVQQPEIINCPSLTENLNGGCLRPNG